MIELRTWLPALAISASVATLAIAPVMAQPAGRAGQCFNTTELGNWRAGDASTLYFRVQLKKIYRLDLKGRCSLLTAPGARLITVFRGSNLICSPLDWDLKVSAGAGDNQEPCIVKSMRLLSPEEVATLPKKLTP